jgi:hypothetical protein
MNNNFCGQNKIPAQSIDLHNLIGDDTNKTYSISEFSISDFITYKEYKKYLNSIKKDSSESFYTSQFPDSNISTNKQVYQSYINENKYDTLPVIGISWENAMNYCKWKTLNENHGNSIDVIYRLPNCSEWLSAYYYFKTNNIPNDMNQLFSDWLLNSKDESLPEISKFMEDYFPYDYIYLHLKEDSPSMKRKFVIGDSFLYQQETLANYRLYSFYSTKGYRQIGFRYIKEQVNQSKNAYPKGESYAVKVLKYWNL